MSEPGFQSDSPRSAPGTPARRRHAIEAASGIVDRTRSDRINTSLRYYRLEPRRVLSVSGSFASGVLTITLDADSDVATVTHDGTNLLLNGSIDIDPGKVGNQEVLLTDLKDIVIEGKAARVDQWAVLDSNFSSLINLSVTDIEQLTIAGTYDFGGDVSVTLNGTGGVSDGGTGALTVGGTTYLDVGNADISLTNSNNDFVGAVSLFANVDPTNDVHLADANDLSLGDVDIAGNLDVSIGGALSNIDGVSIGVVGATSIVADDGNDLNLNNDIVLGDGASDTVSLNHVTLQTKDNVQLDLSADLVFEGVNEAGSLSVTSTGAISDDPATQLNVSGNASFAAGSVTLGDDGADVTNFGSLTFSSTGNVTISEDSSTELAGTNSALNLTLISSGNVTNAASASLVVNDSLAIDANAVQLGDQTGDSVLIDKLTFTTVGAFDLAAESNIRLVGDSTSNSLVLTTTGTLGNEANATLTVANQVQLKASGIQLGTRTNDDFQFGTLSFESAGSVTIEHDAALVIVGTNVADQLTLDVSGKLSNAAGASVVITNNADLTADAIQLGDQAGDQFASGTLRFNSVGDVVIESDASVTTTLDSTANALKLTSNGAITNQANATLDVTNHAELKGSSIDIGGQSGDGIQFGKLTFNSGGSVAIEEDSDILLSGTNTADQLTLASTGGISNEAASSLIVNNQADFEASSLDLGSQTGDQFQAGSVGFDVAGAVTIREDDSTLFAGTVSSQSLDYGSLGSISNAANSQITILNLASFTGTTIDLGQQAMDQFESGSLTFNATGGVVVDADNNIDLEGTSSSTTLTLISSGKIANEANASIDATGAVSLDAGQIDLGTQLNDTFNAQTLTITSSGAVTIEEDSSMTLTGTTSVVDLDLTSTGSISNNANATILVSGNTSLSGSSIQVGQQVGDVFSTTNLTANSAGAVELEIDSDANWVGASSMDSLDIKTTGTLTNSANASLNVTDHAAFDANAIDLGNQSGDTLTAATITFAGTGDVAMSANSDIEVVGSNVASTLTLTSTGTLSNATASSIAVAGLAQFGGSSIDLGTQSGDSIDVGSLTFQSAGDVIINEDSNTALAGTNTANSLTLDSAGAITNETNASLDVTGSASFSGLSLLLGTTAGDSISLGSLEVSVVSDAVVDAESDLKLSGTTAVNNLSLTSTQSILTEAGASIDVSGSTTLDAASIQLGNAVADDFNTGTLTFSSTGSVTISEDSDTLVVGTNAANTLLLESSGALSNSASSVLTVSGKAGFGGTSIDLGTAASDTFNAGTLYFNGTGNVTIEEDSSTRLTSTSTADNLDLTSSGALTNTNNAQLDVQGQGTLWGTSINLGTATGDSFQVSEVNLNSPGAVTFAANSDMLIVGSNAADRFDLRSTGSIQNQAGSLLSATNNASFDAATIDIGNQAGDLFQSGTLSFVSSGDVSIAQDSASTISGTSTADTLSLSSTGAISNAASTTIAISTSANLAGTSIALGDQTGDSIDIGGLRFVTSGAAHFELNGDVWLFGSSSADSLFMANSGAVANDPDASLNVNTLTTFDAATVDVGTQVGDSFSTQQLTLLGNGDVTIEQDADVLLVGSSQVNSLDLTSSGSILNDLNASLVVTNHAAFSGTAIDIGTQAGDAFTTGSLSFDSTGDVSIAEDNATIFAGASSADTLTVTSIGSISNTASADIVVSGLATFNGTSIDVGSALGDSIQLGLTQFTSSGDATIRVDDDLVLTATNTANNIILAAVNTLAMNSGTVLSATGSATLIGSTIDIGTQVGSTFNAGTLAVSSDGVATIHESSDVVFSGVSDVHDLTLVSSGSVSNAANAKLTATGTVDVTATSVTWGDQAGDTLQINQLRATTSGMVGEFDGDLTWVGSSTLDSLTLASTGSVDNSAGASLVVAGATDLSAASISIGAEVGDVFNSSTLTFDSNGAVTILEDSDVNLVGVNTADSLTLRATGMIQDVAGISLQVANEAFFGASGDILLGDDPADNINFGSLGLQGSIAVVTEDSSTHLDGVDVSMLFLGSADLISQSSLDSGAGTGAIEVSGVTFLDLSASNGDILLARASSLPPTTVNDGALMDNRFDGAVTVTGVTGDLRLRNTSSAAGIPVGFGTAFTNLELDFTASSIQLGTLDVSNNLVITSGGDIEDGTGALISVGGDATFTAAGSIVLADQASDSLTVDGASHFNGDVSVMVGYESPAKLNEVTVNSSGFVYLGELDDVILSGSNTADSLIVVTPGDITNDANASIIVSGWGAFQGNSIDLGNAAGDYIEIGNLTLFSDTSASVSLDASTNLSDTWITDDLYLESTGDIGSLDNVSIYVGGDLQLSAASIEIGAAASDYFWFSTLNFSSPGSVWIESEGDIFLVGNSSADSLQLIAQGDIVGAAGGQLLARTAYFEADEGWGDVDLGSTGFTTILTIDSSDLSNSVGFYADNVYLKAFGDVVLDTSWVFDTLYIETQGIIGGGTPRFPAGHVFQRDGTFVYASYLGIDAMGAVQLSSFYAYEIAVSALQTADVISGIVLNSVVEPAIAAAEFGVVLVSDYWTTVGEVLAPFGVGDSVTGLTADTGHLYVETRYNSYLDLFANVVVNDPTKTITAIGDGGIYIFSGYFARGIEGRVSSSSIPLQLNGYGAGTNFVSVDVLSGLQELAFNYGNWGDGPYSAQVVWADGEVDTYNTVQLTALNPSSSTVGDANPIGGSPTVFVKSTPYSADLLLTASSLRSTLTIFGDPGIRLYSNDGLTNLNQATLEFTALVARDKLAIPLRTEEGYSPTFFVDDNQEDGALILSNQAQQQNGFDSAGSQTESSVAEVYTVRVVDGVEMDRMSWAGEFGAGDVHEIKKSVLSKHRFLPGTYSIRRVTADGETVVIDEFEKGSQEREAVEEFQVADNDSQRWYADLPEFQTVEAVAGNDSGRESTRDMQAELSSDDGSARPDTGGEVLSQSLPTRQEAPPAAPAPDANEDYTGADGPVEANDPPARGDIGPMEDLPTSPGIPDVPGPEGTLVLPVAHLSIAIAKRMRQLIRRRGAENPGQAFGSLATEDMPAFDRKSRRSRAIHRKS